MMLSRDTLERTVDPFEVKLLGTLRLDVGSIKGLWESAVTPHVSRSAETASRVGSAMRDQV